MASTMKLLLKESIKNLGRVGDVVEVSAVTPATSSCPRTWPSSPLPATSEGGGTAQGDRAHGARAPRAAGRPHQATRRRRGHARAPRQRAGGTCSAGLGDRYRQGSPAKGFNIEAEDVLLPGAWTASTPTWSPLPVRRGPQDGGQGVDHPHPESKAAIDAYAKAQGRSAAPAGNFERAV